jgi:hypothetical protein
MKPYSEMEFHPVSEKLVKILCGKTQNTNPLFFRITVAYYFALVSSMMHAKVATLDRGEIPINLYALNLAPSGSGKGHSINIMEDSVINQFQHNFTEQTFPTLALANLPILANKRATRNQTDPDDELAAIERDFKSLGPLVFSFDSGTTPAVKAARTKLLMAGAGSVNLQMDEIGSNLLGNMEVLTTFLELFDVGKVKQKLVKNTAENTRHEDIPGRTPTNMMLFGTPSRLLNGGKSEEELYAMLDVGYARRLFFGYSRKHERDYSPSPAEILALRTDASTNQFLEDLSNHLGTLADLAYLNTPLQMSKDVTLLLIEYQNDCEKRADKFGEHEDIKAAEMSHRYFKVLKLAGAYAFIDGLPEVTEEHLYHAIRLAEESGEAFNKLLSRDRPYVKLAKYIADISRPVTQADLVEDLPFYKGSTAQKAELMQLAIAHGYQNNILIRKAFEDGIEFIRGEALKPTDLNSIRVSYSNDIAVNYREDTAKFEDLHKLTQLPGMHWCNHYFKGGHRAEDDAIPGFNIVVLDIDSGINMSTAQLLLTDYTALFYTTKRHTATDHRFRIVLPTNYELKLDAHDYKEFMRSLFQWLPFDVDLATGQRARKWLTHNGAYAYQDGVLLDVLPFIPKTSKNEEFKATVLDQQGMDNLERWVINNTGDGNRNNMLLRYALILVDGGFDFAGILSHVNGLNNKLPEPLDETEILSTIMVSVTKALAKP